jgi:hypothetical protein
MIPTITRQKETRDHEERAKGRKTREGDSQIGRKIHGICCVLFFNMGWIHNQTFYITE